MKQCRHRALLVGGALILWAAMPSASDDWPRFRGVRHQGVGVAQQSPTFWSPNTNISWKTAVRGSGHSSPIVAGDRIFVTTAYEAEGAQVTLRGARLLRAALGIAALALWLFLPMRVPRWHRAVAAALVTLLAVLAVADERVFQLGRSPARAWLGAGLSMVVGLFVSMYGLSQTGVARRALAAALGVAGVLLVAWMPGGLDQSRALGLALGVIAGVSVLGGLWGLRGAFRATNTGADGPVSRAHQTPRLVAAWRACVLSAAMLGLVIVLVLVPHSEIVYAVVCVDRTSGRIVWIREGLWGPRTAVHRANSLATPTAVTDGERVFAYFGTPGLMAVNADGEMLWTNSRAPFETIYGVGASPVLVQTSLIVASFTPEGPYLAVFDAATGQERWKTSRVSVHPEFGDSRTPLVVPTNARLTVIVWGIDELAGYDLETGRVLWRYAHGANHRMGSMVVSLLAGDDVLYLPLENGMVALSLPALAAGRPPELWTSRGGRAVCPRQSSMRAVSSPCLRLALRRASTPRRASCSGVRAGRRIFRLARRDGGQGLLHERIGHHHRRRGGFRLWNARRERHRRACDDHDGRRGWQPLPQRTRKPVRDPALIHAP